MPKRIVCALLALVMLLAVSPAGAAMNATMRIKGPKGDIKGGVTQKGREGTIAVHSSSHEVVSPRDAATGLPTGKRMHKPFTVTMEVDRSVPLLYKAISNNDLLPEIELRYYRPTQTGLDVNFYTVKLTNAYISRIAFTHPAANTAEQARLVETVEVSFTYQKIEYTVTDGAVSAQDEWVVGVSNR